MHCREHTSWVYKLPRTKVMNSNVKNEFLSRLFSSSYSPILSKFLEESCSTPHNSKWFLKTLCPISSVPFFPSHEQGNCYCIWQLWHHVAFLWLSPSGLSYNAFDHLSKHSSPGRNFTLKKMKVSFSNWKKAEVVRCLQHWFSRVCKVPIWHLAGNWAKCVKSFLKGQFPHWPSQCISDTID